MLNIFHGENIDSSRKSLNGALDAAKKQSPHAEILHLDGNKLTETDLIGVLESPSMFASGRIIHIDGLLSRRPSKEKDRLIDRVLSYLSLIPASPAGRPYPLSLLLWEPKQLSAAALKKFHIGKDCRIQLFKLSKSLWNFLDSFRPGNSVQSLPLFHSTLQIEPAELVIYHLVKRITGLLLAKNGSTEALAGLKSDWQMSKLVNQAKYWKENELVTIHRKLLQIDEAVKTGSTPADLSTHLDILLLTL